MVQSKTTRKYRSKKRKYTHKKREYRTKQRVKQRTTKQRKKKRVKQRITKKHKKLIGGAPEYSEDGSSATRRSDPPVPGTGDPDAGGDAAPGRRRSRARRLAKLEDAKSDSEFNEMLALAGWDANSESEFNEMLAQMDKLLAAERPTRTAVVPPPEGGAAPTRTPAPATTAAPAPSPVRVPPPSPSSPPSAGWDANSESEFNEMLAQMDKLLAG